MEGLVLFNKPKGYTSNQIVEYFKKITNKKVGHGGTLDPLASGLLILGIGEFTKELSNFLKNSKKTYIAEIKLGYVSDTYDKEGKILATNKLIPNIDEIKKILENFKGVIRQKPPIFSAIKIKGKPAYKLARKGIKVEISEKEVEVYNIEILNYDENNKILKLKLEVSSGFYVRSFANDLGEKLMCGGYLENLERVAINEYKLEEALTFEDIEKDYLEVKINVYGLVQGVGFRFFTKRVAKEFNLFGYVKNLNDGSVEIIAQGREQELQKFIERVKIGPTLAKVEKINILFIKPINLFYNFEIL